MELRDVTDRQPSGHISNPTSLLQNDRRHSKLRVEDMDPDVVCGIGNCKPQWLQKFATPTVYLIFYCIIGIIQGSHYTYRVGVLTTMERRYGFETKISGTIVMVDEITPLILGILIGYFGGKMNRPKALAAGMFSSALCCILSAVPYFIYGSGKAAAGYSSNSTMYGTEYCARDVDVDMCTVHDRPPTTTVVLIEVVASFMKGFGTLSYGAVGMSYLDDNSNKGSSPLMFGIALSSRSLGPIVGYLLASASLSFYEDPFDYPGYGPDDPRWIGAWWLGFVILGILIAIATCPLLLFPRTLPQRGSVVPRSTVRQETFSEHMTGMVKAVKRLMTNKFYVVFMAAAVIEINGNMGYYLTMPKYTEYNFRLSASRASLLSGPASILPVLVSTLLGGILIWKFRPSAKFLLFGTAASELLEVAFVLFLMVPACTIAHFPGTDTSAGVMQLNNTCNADCLCTTKKYIPACGPDGVSTYFSPCHAGCTEKFQNDTHEIFSNCSCLYDFGRNETFTGSVVAGYCQNEECWPQAVTYISIVSVMSILAALFQAAHVVIMFRAIEPQDKSISLGLLETFACGLAYIPGPVIFGSLVDKACIVWEESCGETGNCWLYSQVMFRFIIHGLCAAIILVDTIAFTVTGFMTHRLRDLYKEEEGDTFM